MVSGPIAKAKVLLESLPYIKKFQNSTMVVKYGGSVMEDNELQERIVLDMLLLKLIGIRVVVVHGGGQKINGMLARLGKESKFSNGLRITDSDTVDIVEMVLVGAVNKRIVTLFSQHGGEAVGISGKDGNLVTARRVGAHHDGDNMVDVGHVGEITSVNPRVVNMLTNEGYIPIISSVASCPDGDTLNINADTMAGEIAAALGAKKLFLMTDVEGVSDNDGQLITSINMSDYQDYKDRKVISGGMLPKLDACKHALENGVSKVHIISGILEHSLLLEIFTEEGIGTEVVL